MIKNISNPDRIVRILISILFVVLYFTGTVTGTVGIVLLVLAGVFTLTALINFCPIYYFLGIKTLKDKK